MSNREIELQRQLDAARAQAQRLREAALAFWGFWIHVSDWSHINGDAFTDEQRKIIADFRDALRDTEPHGGTEAQP